MILRLGIYLFMAIIFFDGDVKVKWKRIPRYIRGFAGFNRMDSWGHDRSPVVLSVLSGIITPRCCGTEITKAGYQETYGTFKGLLANTASFQLFGGPLKRYDECTLHIIARRMDGSDGRPFRFRFNVKKMKKRDFIRIKNQPIPDNPTAMITIPRASTT